MTQAKDKNIEIFCREFTQAFYRISGNMVIIDPDLLARQIENDMHPDKEQIPKGKHEEAIANECSDVIDKCNRLLPTSPDGRDLQVINHDRNSSES